MFFTDSIDKIVFSYFQAFSAIELDYKGKKLPVKSLHISPLLLRGFECPSMCAGCCPRFSLDYFPWENKPQGVSKRIITINGISKEIFSDLQLENKDHFCKHVNKIDGRCLIHGVQPFSCDFELIKTIIYQDPNRANLLVQKKFGRGWSHLLVTGERGSLCEITEVTQESISEVKRKLSRLQEIMNYFEIPMKKIKLPITRTFYGERKEQK